MNHRDRGGIYLLRELDYGGRELVGVVTGDQLLDRVQGIYSVSKRTSLDGCLDLLARNKRYVGLIRGRRYRWEDAPLHTFDGERLTRGEPL